MSLDTNSMEPTHAERALDAATENSLYGWLEGHLFNRIIGYTIHPLHISLPLLLWISLLVWHNTVFELVGGNYTNGLSAMAASIVLLQQVGYQRELKRMHRQHIGLLHEYRNLLEEMRRPKQ